MQTFQTLQSKRQWIEAPPREGRYVQTIFCLTKRNPSPQFHNNNFGHKCSINNHLEKKSQQS